MNGASPAPNDTVTTEPQRLQWPAWAMGLLTIAALVVLAIMVWQGIVEQGSPDPTKESPGSSSALLDIGVLVFREGLECILVLCALTATMVGPQEGQRRPVAVGVGVGILATIVTWFIAVGILNSLTDNVSALNLQAATGLLAIVVLLIVMNWFFHKLYWGGWISLHHRKKKSLISEAGTQQITTRRLAIGLALLGFSSFYREGFEVVLFLQSYRLKLGSSVVLLGTLIGVILTVIIGVLTFVAHRRLPYRKMLVLTGVMLGAVLLVMVGEQAQEMQLAHWIPTTEIAFLKPYLPDWTGVWFGLFPTVETMIAQGIAAVLVVGSYYGTSLRGKSNSPAATDTDAVPADS